MDFVFGLPKDKTGNTGIVVFVAHLSKMAHLAAVPDTIDGASTALLFIDRVFRQYGLPETIVSDRDPRFTAKFWKSLFQVLGTGLDMSTADQPQTDGQTERVNRVVEDILRSLSAEAPRRWSEVLPLVEFALNNAVNASTGFTPFYVNGLANPRVPLTPLHRGSGVSGGGITDRLADISPIAVCKQVDDFVSLRLSVLRQVRDAMAESQDLQKEYADTRGRVSADFKMKLRLRFIGPFKVVAKKGLAYTLNLPKKMRTHPVFYTNLPPSGRVGRSCRERRSSASDHADPARTRRGDSQREGPDEARPPAALLDEHGELHYDVERLVARRRRQSRT
ncbi:hypothetical protein PI124_g17703 [Phytophthora idaei]|nr:hypothetical protein PI124_g17703 [Phytophthora idaei]